MAKHSRASIRYARALLGAADLTSGVNGLREEAEGLRSFIADSPEFGAFLTDPTITKQAKIRTLDVLLKSRVTPLTWRFIVLLTEKYRESLLPEILEAVTMLLDERAGKLIGEVRSATELTSEQQASLCEQLKRFTGNDVVLTVSTDPSLVAGFVARVGDTVFDASLAAQLTRLRASFGRADIGTFAA